jgi:hypothetical protein
MRAAFIVSDLCAFKGTAKTYTIFGAKLGAYSREDQLTTEDYEMLVIAEKYREY